MKKFLFILSAIVSLNTFAQEKGNVGIGTDKPETKLHVHSNNNWALQLTSSLHPEVKINSYIGKTNYNTNLLHGYIGTSSNHAFSLMTNNETKLSILPNGNVGIGHANPEYKLRIYTDDEKYGFVHTSDYASIGSYIGYSKSSDKTYGAWFGTLTNHALFFMVNNNRAAYFSKNGNFSIGYDTPSEKLSVNGKVLANEHITPSDIRLKKDITNNTYGLTEVLSLKTINYRYKDETKGKEKRIGFIAQDMQKYIPEIVTVGKDKDKTLSLDYSEMSVVLTKAIQEQQKLIENQNKQIEELKQDIMKLKNK